MHNLKQKILVATVLALQLCGAFADSVSDRITVTVCGNGPDVLLIPGLACSSAVWDATAKRLTNHFRFHLIQVAGFGGSPTRANTNGPILLPTVDAIDLYIKTNHLKSPKIIGHSLGGLAGMILAIQHPEDVDKLMVVDALPFFGVLSGAKDAAAATPGAGDALIRPSQPGDVLGRSGQVETRVRPLHQRDRRVDDGQHAHQPRGDSERVSD